MRGKLDAFARDPAKNARHVIKAMFVFALLDRERIVVDAVGPYLAKVPCYGRLSQRFRGQAPQALACWLLEELHRSGAVVVGDGVVSPAARA